MSEPTDSINHDPSELDRLRQHNRELLAELKEARAALKPAQDALEAAQSASNEWKQRWHQVAVLKPLEDDLRAVAAGPWKYLRDLALESKLLMMEPDAEGVERPVWRDEKGEPADLSQGLYRFLCRVCDRGVVPDLGCTIRGSGASGMGSGPSAPMPSRWHAQNSEAKPDPEKPAFGLR